LRQVFPLLFFTFFLVFWLAERRTTPCGKHGAKHRGMLLPPYSGLQNVAAF
jgi:hypothetical protein